MIASLNIMAKTFAKIAKTVAGLLATIIAHSKSSGRTFTMSTDDLKNIIVNVIRMVGNASYSSSLSALSGMSPSSWLMDSACCNHMTPHSSLDNIGGFH